MIACTEVYTELLILSSSDQKCIIQQRGLCWVRVGRGEEIEQNEMVLEQKLEEKKEKKKKKKQVISKVHVDAKKASIR